jgi:hypothetical protein
MKTEVILAILLSCTAAAPAQSLSEKLPVNENYMYTYRTTPRYNATTYKPLDLVYEPSYKNVKPPLADYSVARKNYSVDNQSGSVIVHSSGTTLIIPKDAFVDENGREVEGSVTINYREFKNPVDFILGGIPMSFEKDGNKNMFISAGMFELTASSEGKPVYLKNDKRIDVEMVSTDKKPDYNLYAFNDESGTWEERENKENIPVTESIPTTYSNAVNVYLRNLSYGSGKKPVDTVSCRRRFESNNYFYTSKSIGTLAMKKNRWWVRGDSYSALIKITDVRKNRKDGSVVFRIARVVGNTHNELGIYNRTAWKVDAKSYPELKKALSNKNRFFDVRIEKDGDAYTIKLKSSNGFTEISAVPMKMTRNKKVCEYPKKIEDYFYKIYCRLLKSREKSFDKQIARDLKNYKKAVSYGKKEQRAWINTKYIMTPDERSKPFEEWKAYVETEKKSQRKLSDATAATSSNIIRSFSIDGMGIWNCDQIYRIQDPIKVIAQYKDGDGNKIKTTATYVVDKKLNGVLQYNSDEIIFSPSSDNIFIAVKENGDIAYTTSEDLRLQGFANNRYFVFPLKDVNASSTTVEDLRKLIGM